MKRADKLKILHDALQGYWGPLEKLYHQKRKDATRYLDAVGMVDVGRCPMEFLSLTVSHSYAPASSNEDFLFEPLSTSLHRYNEQERTLWRSPFNAVGLIDADDSQYDTLLLRYFRVQRRDYSYIYLPDITVADLRRWFTLCAGFFDEPRYIGLLFETDFVWLDNELEVSRQKQHNKN